MTASDLLQQELVSLNSAAMFAVKETVCTKMKVQSFKLFQTYMTLFLMLNVKGYFEDYG